MKISKELLALIVAIAEVRNVRKVRTGSGKVRKIGRWFYGDDKNLTIYEGRAINGKILVDEDTVKESFGKREYVERLLWLEHQPERFQRQAERTDENGIGWGAFGEEPDESGYDLAEMTERSAID